MSSSLPREAEMEILSWLPVEEVVRLQVVCKAWYSMLGDQSFIELWSRRTRFRSPSFLLRLLPRGAGMAYLSVERSRQGRWGFCPPASRLVLSTGGLVLCKTSTTYMLGNPVTQQWVHVPCMQWPPSGTQRLLQYMSGGQVFFKIWLHPFVFDSRVGIWTHSVTRRTFVRSFNSVCIGGVYYAIGECPRHSALVLLEVGESAEVGNWICAWDETSFAPNEYNLPLQMYFRLPVCMLDIGGEVGFMAMLSTAGHAEASAFVLDRSRSDGWRWKRVWRHCPRGSVAYNASTGAGYSSAGQPRIVIFDPRTLSSHWSQDESWPHNLVTFEADLAARVHVNRPSSELQEACASRHNQKNVDLLGHVVSQGVEGNFSRDLESRLKSRGVSWRDIGQQLEGEAPEDEYDDEDASNFLLRRPS